MLNKRKLKSRNIAKRFYAVMVRPLIKQQVKVLDQYHGIQQRLLSSKHLNDGGAEHAIHLGLNNSYVDQFKELETRIDNRLVSARKYQ